MITLQAERWRAIGRALFIAAGATESNAARVAASLVDANLTGHDSHGVVRFTQYLQGIEAGQLLPAGQPRVIRETAVSSLVDGAWTFGQVGAELAMKRAIAKAKESGMAISALIHSDHIGRLGEYCDMGFEAGMIGIVTVGGFGPGPATPRGVAPFGGARPVFGTNPIAFGFPGGVEPPVLADFATSTVAAGKVIMARAKGEQLPPGCLVDREGRPTTDPEDYYRGGSLVPVGGHKGSGLAMAVELLSQALTGGDAFHGETAEGIYSRGGALFISINPGLFRPVEDYAAAADATIRRVKAVPPAVGVDEVLVAGEPERRSKARRLVEGISVPDSTWGEIQKAGAKYGVDVLALAG